MTEVAAGTPTTGVAPLAVLGGHPDDAPADRVHAPWAARSATAAAVVFPRDQLSMPAEEGIGRDQGVPVTAYPSPEARGLCGQAPALGVGEPETARTELLSEDAILCLERVNDVTRLLVDPARDGHDEALQHLGKRRCFCHQLLPPRPYLVLTKQLRLDIQCQRGASVKIGWKYLDD